MKAPVYLQRRRRNSLPASSKFGPTSSSRAKGQVWAWHCVSRSSIYITELSECTRWRGKAEPSTSASDSVFPSELVEEKQDVLKATSATASIRASTNDQNNYYHKSSEAYGSHPCRRRYVDLTEFFNSDCDIIIYFLKENFRRKFQPQDAAGCIEKKWREMGRRAREWAVGGPSRPFRPMNMGSSSWITSCPLW